MSCPEFAISPRGRAGLGVIQPQAGLDYPFVNPSDDIRYLVADFYFAHNADADYLPETAAIVYPLRIKRLYNVGCNVNAVPTDHVPRGGSAVDIVLVDASDSVVFDTTTASGIVETTAPWGDDYTIYTWQTDKEICRILLYTTWAADDDEKRNYDKYLAPTAAVLDARSVYRMPKHVRTLYVRNGNYTTGPYKNDVIFSNSYNTEITAGAATTVQLRRTTRISFAAVPGSGAGKYPCAENELAQEYPIKKINGVSATDGGHLTLAADDCIWVRRPTVYVPESPQPYPLAFAQQQIGADCKPCCACSDYAATALFMNYTRDRYKLIGQRAADIRNVHDINVTRWNAYRQCTISNPLKLVIVPQRAPFIDVAIMVCNNCETCLPASSLQVAITVLSAVTVNTGSAPEGIAINDVDATVVCGYTEVYFPGVAAKTTIVNKLRQLTYETTFPQLKAGDSGYIKFRLEFSVRAELEIQAILTGTTNTGDAIPLRCGELDQATNAPTPASAIVETTLNFHRAGKESRSC